MPRRRSTVAASISSAVGGSEGISRSVSRTEPMSSGPRGARRVRGRHRRSSSVEPPPMSSDQRSAASTSASDAGRAVVGQRGLLVTADHLGPHTEPLVDAVGERRRVVRVARGRGRDEAQRLRRRAPSMTGRTPRTAANTRASASSASRPVRSTSCPSRTIRSSRTRLSWVPAARSRSATSSLMVLVPQSTAATRVMPAPSRSSPLTQRPAAQNSPSRSSTSSPSGFTPRPCGERLAGQHVQALDPVGMPAGGDAVDLGHVTDRLAGREVALVRVACTPRRAPGPRPAARSSPSSAPMPRACRSARRPAGRSGRRSSGTACRRGAAARSRPRRGCRTGSGAPTSCTPRGGRPSWAAMTASSSAAINARPSASCGASIFATGGGTLALVDLWLAGRHDAAPGRCHHCGRVASVTEFGSATACRCGPSGLPLASSTWKPISPGITQPKRWWAIVRDVGRVVPALLLAASVGRPWPARSRCSSLQLGDVPALLEVGAHARRVGHHQHARAPAPGPPRGR